jgi:hypothetical protein
VHAAKDLLAGGRGPGTGCLLAAVLVSGFLDCSDRVDRLVGGLSQRLVLVQARCFNTMEAGRAGASSSGDVPITTARDSAAPRPR